MNATQTKHTHSELPLELRPECDYGWDLYSGGHWVGQVNGPHGGHNGFPSRDQAEANAAFIVRACNAHYALVEALRELIEQLEGIGIPDWHGAEGLSLDQAKAALSLAKQAK